MRKAKWGESFLKSGLPLEHITLLTFKRMQYYCSPNVEYARVEEPTERWFELDLFASSWRSNRVTDLSFLVECKYHDLSRFWFFLPCEEGRWQFNDRVFNCAPVQTLARPRARGALALAPLSHRGLVVSKDGTKQENAVEKAFHQLSNGFVPYTLSHMFYLLDVIEGYSPHAMAIVPMIVTNAKIFRLRPTLRSLDRIRNAARPSDIADELGWTWCYFDPPMDLFDRNLDRIDIYKERNKELLSEFPSVESIFRSWSDRPNWIAVVNISALKSAVSTIQKYFFSIKTKPTEPILGKRQTKTSNNEPNPTNEPAAGGSI